MTIINVAMLKVSGDQNDLFWKLSPGNELDVSGEICVTSGMN